MNIATSAARNADSRLHETIAGACGNNRLAGEIRRYLWIFRALRNVSHLRDSWNEYRRSDDVPEHQELVKALMEGKPKGAAEAMDFHIRSVEKTLADVMFTESAMDAMEDGAKGKEAKKRKGKG